MPMRRFAALAALVLAMVSARPSAAGWPSDPTVNVPVCTAAENQQNPAIVTDGAGGAIVAWQDFRDAPYMRIYAQHLLANGGVDPGWPADGLLVCSASDREENPAIASDGVGGAIVTWGDFRNEPHFDIYAQHVLASGAIDPAWPSAGLAVCAAAENQQHPAIAPDGAGGAIVAWDDFRSAPDHDIYAQRVLASGAVDPAWPANGRGVCTAADDQMFPTIATDGAGGAIVAWQDFRSAPYHDIYAQRVLASGALDPAWPAGGRGVCTAADDQNYPTIVTDGAGGAIVAWQDFRSAPYRDIFAQHVLASGGLDPAWPADGRGVCTAAGDQQHPAIVTNGAGGAIVAWEDFRGDSPFDVYAARVGPGGVVDPAWPADGRAVSTATENQQHAAIATDGAGGAIVAWEDFRNAPWYDVYAQRVRASGELGDPPTAATRPATPALTIEGVRPNPARRDFVVAFTLATEAPASVELVDLSGRIVQRRDLDARPGGQRVELRTGGTIPPGVYVVRLVQGGRSVGAKACFVR